MRQALINHAAAAFTQNKRCRQEQRQCDDVVNRRAAAVYQTECGLVSIEPARRVCRQMVSFG